MSTSGSRWLVCVGAMLIQRLRCRTSIVPTPDIYLQHAALSLSLMLLFWMRWIDGASLACPLTWDASTREEVRPWFSFLWDLVVSGIQTHGCLTCKHTPGHNFQGCFHFLMVDEAVNKLNVYSLCKTSQSLAPRRWLAQTRCFNLSI